MQYDSIPDAVFPPLQRSIGKRPHMKIKLRTFAAWIAGLIGVSSCDIIGFGVCMYATPYADYNIDILVTDTEGNPIPEIVAKRDSLDTRILDRTGEDGHLRVRMDDEYVFGEVLFFEDVDGPENGGEFESRYNDRREIKSTLVTKGKSWYKGEYELTGTVKLKKK